MDVKSMLNDGGQRPSRIQTTHAFTPQSSYDARTENTPGSDSSSTRPTPYLCAPPSSTLDTRAHGGGSAGAMPAGNGSYFTLQSPYPNTSTSASTPSVGPHSAYAQSPGSYMGGYTPRESQPTSNAPAAAHNATFVSPTPTHPPIPPTPASVHHHNYSRSTSYNNSAYPANPPNHAQFQSSPPQVNGLLPSSARHNSPINQFQSQPATPLGPPVHYPKGSPQSYRPPSQGHESHLRRASQSSIGSILSNREQPQYPPPPPAEHTRRDSVQRPYIYDVRDRERSISVSPKTIPKPAPHREHDPRRTLSHDRPSIPPHPEPASRPVTNHQNSLDQQLASTPDSQFAPPNTSMYSSPQGSRLSEQHAQHYGPMAYTDEPATATASANYPHNSLKRRASHLSDTIVKPPQKKPRRYEVPPWARSARNPDKQKPIRFVEGGLSRSSHPQRPAATQATRKDSPAPLKPNGNSVVSQPVDLPIHDQPNIANRVQYDVLTPTVCEWVLQFIGQSDPPPRSKFEIEAKVGLIIRNDTDSRLEPMVWTEAVLTEQAVHNTKFHSGMTLEQHKVMNEYLNDLVRQNTAAGFVGTPNEIFYSHPKENDEFYELSDEGKKHLPSELYHWTMKAAHPRRRNEIRVRRTVDKFTGAVTAQIIKTRVADINITCPRDPFDYRISISLETDWDGDTAWLTPLAETRGRNKDRMSYRHRMYQVDLTQVSHENSPDKEHELEVEVATEYLQRELHRLRTTGESSLYDVVHGLISNIRLFTKLGQ